MKRLLKMFFIKFIKRECLHICSWCECKKWCDIYRYPWEEVK